MIGILSLWQLVDCSNDEGNREGISATGEHDDDGARSVRDEERRHGKKKEVHRSKAELPRREARRGLLLAVSCQHGMRDLRNGKKKRTSSERLGWETTHRTTEQPLSPL